MSLIGSNMLLNSLWSLGDAILLRIRGEQDAEPKPVILPGDILRLIVQDFKPSEKARLRRVCKGWKVAIEVMPSKIAGVKFIKSIHERVLPLLLRGSPAWDQSAHYNPNCSGARYLGGRIDESNQVHIEFTHGKYWFNHQFHIYISKCSHRARVAPNADYVEEVSLSINPEAAISPGNRRLLTETCELLSRKAAIIKEAGL